MEVLIIIVLIGIVWLIWHVIGRSEKQQKEEPKANLAAERSGLKVTIPGAEVPKQQSSTSTAKKTIQKSSDAIYADSHNMWICKHCESLNNVSTQNCIACGCKKAG